VGSIRVAGECAVCVGNREVRKAASDQKLKRRRESGSESRPGRIPVNAARGVSKVHNTG